MVYIHAALLVFLFTLLAMLILYGIGSIPLSYRESVEYNVRSRGYNFARERGNVLSLKVDYCEYCKIGFGGGYGCRLPLISTMNGFYVI